MRLNLADHSVELVHPAESMPERELTVAADGSAYAYVNVHPDGKRLLLVSERKGRSDLYWLELPQ